MSERVKPPRGECPVCHRRFRVTQNNGVYLHKDGPALCIGSGDAPVANTIAYPGEPGDLDQFGAELVKEGIEAIDLIITWRFWALVVLAAFAGGAGAWIVQEVLRR
jgi:hypothetical protein